jgi:hypothetical protein
LPPREYRDQRSASMIYRATPCCSKKESQSVQSSLRSPRGRFSPLLTREPQVKLTSRISHLFQPLRSKVNTSKLPRSTRMLHDSRTLPGLYSGRQQRFLPKCGERLSITPTANRPWGLILAIVLFALIWSVGFRKEFQDQLLQLRAQVKSARYKAAVLRNRLTLEYPLGCIVLHEPNPYRLSQVYPHRHSPCSCETISPPGTNIEQLRE